MRRYVEPAKRVAREFVALLAAIMRKLQPVMKKRTTLFVSHRISTLQYADEIIVIEDGRITQQGSHAELLKQPGYYAELNTLQQIERQLEADS